MYMEDEPVFRYDRPVFEDPPGGGFYYYRKLADDPIVSTLWAAARGNIILAQKADDAVAGLLDFAGKTGMTGNLWQGYLTYLLTQDENAFSLAAERAPAPTGSAADAARDDLAAIREVFHTDFPELSRMRRTLLLNFSGTATRDALEPDRLAALEALRQTLADAPTVDAFLTAVCDFYRTEGVGPFALYRAFRPTDDPAQPVLTPLTRTRRVQFSDLIGYESQKRLLRANTEAFLAGRPANHVLLYGDGGTGKSTSIQALLETYAADGLRMVEIDRDRYAGLGALTRLLARRNYRFVIVLDDLSFEENETAYKHLKSHMEGGLEPQPENVRIYATSNRRHLIRESWNDRSDYETDLHRSETTEEKLSLASRFGLSILYLSPSHQEYLQVVTTLAERAGLRLPREELEARAIQWKMQHSGSVTGRTAQQFVDSLVAADSAAIGPPA